MKIVCIGDSLTQGYGIIPSESWVERLNKMYEIEFVNKGINGDTTGGMLARFHRDVLDEKPSRVLIMGGVNDLITGSSPGSIQSNIMAMVHQAYHHRIIPMIGISIKADSQTFRKDWAELTNISELNALIQEYRFLLIHFCRIFKIEYIDFYSEFDRMIQGDYRSVMIDGLHPTSEGHRILAEIASRYLIR